MALTACIAGAFTACTKAGPQTEPVKMTAREAMGLVANDFGVIVDVREKDETDFGMAAPASWMPTSESEDSNPKWQDFVAKLPKDKTVVLYCASGARAQKVAERLSKRGFKTAYISGFQEWRESGLPVKTRP